MDDKDVVRLEDRIEALGRESQLRLELAMSRIDAKFDTILHGLASLQTDLTGQRTALTDQGVSLRTALTDQGVSLRTALDEQGVSLGTALDEQGVSLRAALDEQGVSLHTALDEQGVSHRTALDEHRVSQRTALDEHRVSLRTALDEHRVSQRAALDDLRGSVRGLYGLVAGAWITIIVAVVGSALGATALWGGGFQAGQAGRGLVAPQNTK